jgi:hypothetical protein
MALRAIANNTAVTTRLRSRIQIAMFGLARHAEPIAPALNVRIAAR